LCDAVDSLKRVPSRINLYKKTDPAQTSTGSVVKEYIETAHEEIKNMKEKLKQGWKDDE
jgi:hypothetical protein